MSLLVGVALLGLLVAAGWWPMQVLAAPLAGPTLPGRAAIACALGAALTGLVQLALSVCGEPAGVAAPVVLAVLSVLLSRTRIRTAAGRVGQAAEPGPAGSGVPAQYGGAAAHCPRWLAALVIFVALVSLGTGVGLPFRSDGSKFWAPKARELARSGASEAPSLHDPLRQGLHRDYPLLVPALLAPAFALSPQDAAAGPKLLLGALTVALLGVLAMLLPRCGARGVVLLAVFTAQPLLVSLDVRESAVAAGFVDSVDALFLLLFVVAVECLREGGDGAGSSARPGAGATVVLACLAGAALVSTKLEGAVEAACVFGAALVAGPRRGALLAVAAGALLLALPTLILRADVVPDEPGFELARLLDGAVLQARLLPVLAGLFGLLVDVSSFGLLPLLLLLWALQRAPPGGAGPGPGGVAGAHRRRRAFAATLCALAVAFFVASYLSTSMQTSRHIDTSAHRLLWHWLPAATWLVARRGLPAGDRASALSRAWGPMSGPARGTAPGAVPRGAPTATVETRA